MICFIFYPQAENQYGKHNRSIELVQSPVVEGLDAEGAKLSWTVHSHQPLEKIHLELRQLNGVCLELDSRVLLVLQSGHKSVVPQDCIDIGKGWNLISGNPDARS